ncbi:hypothetical protein BDZ89DRAFT_1165632 [Hymenopellis radicata]|nr:hypothetical protein BDZ89DRAFT_1165632 [Hymenopellis radicata]
MSPMANPSEIGQSFVPTIRDGPRDARSGLSVSEQALYHDINEKLDGEGRPQYKGFQRSEPMPSTLGQGHVNHAPPLREQEESQAAPHEVPSARFSIVEPKLDPSNHTSRSSHLSHTPKTFSGALPPMPHVEQTTRNNLGSIFTENFSPQQSRSTSPDVHEVPSTHFQIVEPKLNPSNHSSRSSHPSHTPKTSSGAPPPMPHVEQTTRNNLGSIFTENFSPQPSRSPSSYVTTLTKYHPSTPPLVSDAEQNKPTAEGCVNPFQSHSSNSRPSAKPHAIRSQDSNRASSGRKSNKLQKPQPLREWVLVDDESQ